MVFFFIFKWEGMLLLLNCKEILQTCFNPHPIIFWKLHAIHTLRASDFSSLSWEFVWDFSYNIYCVRVLYIIWVCIWLYFVVFSTCHVARDHCMLLEQRRKQPRLSLLEDVLKNVCFKHFILPSLIENEW